MNGRKVPPGGGARVHDELTRKFGEGVVFRAEGPVQPLLDDGLQSADAAYRLRQVCHDARQELALIAALAEKVQAAAGLSPEHSGQLDTLLRLARDLASTMCDAAAQVPQAHLVDISNLVREVGEQAGMLSGSQVISVVDDDLVLECDPLLARRGLLNLLDNATRAAGPDGCVRVSAASTDRGLVIEVEDSGPGFGSAAPGLASIGLSVVRDWVNAASGVLHIGKGGLGGASLQLVFFVPRAAATRASQPSR